MVMYPAGKALVLERQFIKKFKADYSAALDKEEVLIPLGVPNRVLSCADLRAIAALVTLRELQALKLILLSLTY